MSRMKAVGCVAVCFSVLLVGASAEWGQASGGETAATPQVGVSSTAPTETPGTAEQAGTVPEKTGKGSKTPYRGSTETIVLPPTPMLDEEGRQRIDPDGHPMFNPPLKQQCDKKGHPWFDADGKPVMQTARDLGYDEHGKRIKPPKEKGPQRTPVSISRGTFTVDGVIGKAGLNYAIADLKYLYLFVPGMGVTVVSHAPFEGAKEQKDAFDDQSLIVTVGEHRLEVASDVPLLGRRRRPESAYVRLDRGFMLASAYPAVGYGVLLARPYVWPASTANAALRGAVQPPALPFNLRQTQVAVPCPTGQRRQSGASVAVAGTAGAAAGSTPGAGAPCVPIPSASAPATAAAVQSSRADAPGEAPGALSDPQKETTMPPGAPKGADGGVPGGGWS
jgi:hypothetical protein